MNYTRKRFSVAVGQVRGNHPKQADLVDVFAPKCPICGAGLMYEHDTGYDECGTCDFFVIYYPRTWATNADYRAILEDGATEWRKLLAPVPEQRTLEAKRDAVTQSCDDPPGPWTRTIRGSGLLEHVCQHGVGHPDPASARKLGEGFGIHGCDGCCQRDDFPGRANARPLAPHAEEVTT